jgi:hypothetical protein
MKMLLGFFMGTTVGLLVVLFIFHNSHTVSADGANVTTSAGSAATAVSAADPTATKPDGTDVVGLMPDGKKDLLQRLGRPLPTGIERNHRFRHRRLFP